MLRRGMTLAECVISIALLTIVMSAMTSVVVVASRALPGRADRIDSVCRASRTVDRILSDLSAATAMTVDGQYRVQATVPDRDADSNPETIVYRWSGVAGDPLERVYNGSAQVVEPAVYAFTPSCATRDATRSIQTTTTSAEQVLAYRLVGNVPSIGTLTNPFADTPTAQSISTSNWTAQYFEPRLPPGATAWSVTRVAVAAKVSGLPTGSGNVEIRSSLGSLIEAAGFLELSLGSNYGWQTLSYSNVTNRAPGAGLWIVVRGTGIANACDLAYQNAGSADHRALVAYTANNATSWTVNPDASIAFVVYGTVTAPTPATQALTRATALTVRLATRRDQGAIVESTLRLPSEPVVSVVVQAPNENGGLLDPLLDPIVKLLK